VLDFSIGGLALPGISPDYRSRDKTNPAQGRRASEGRVERLAKLL
jgi:hypothetical protein